MSLKCCQARLAEGFWAPVGCLLWLLHLLFMLFCDLIEQRREQARKLRTLRERVSQMEEPLLPQQV